MRQVDLDRLALPHFETAVRVVAAQCQRQGVPFMLIGAIARDLLLNHLRDLGRGFRLTEDLDVSVMVPDWDAYHCIREGLLSHPSVDATDMVHRLMVHHMAVDLVPFGGLEQPIGYIEWPSDSRVMDVSGYREAFHEAEQIGLGDLVLRVVPLLAYVPMKVVTWRDRSFERDALDICTILLSYYDVAIDSIVETDTDLFELEDGDQDFIGARAYGRHVTNSRSVSPGLLGEMTRILEVETNRTRMAVSMGPTCHHDLERRLRLLDTLTEGARDAPEQG